MIALRFARFRFTLAFTAPAVFEQLAGFTLRSALGRALRRADRPAYERLYRETPSFRAARFHRKTPCPRPYVLRLEEPLLYEAFPGQLLDVEFVLLGTDDEVLGENGHVTSLIVGLLHAEADVLGARRQEGFGRFRLLHVAAVDAQGRRRLVWDRSDPRLIPLADWLGIDDFAAPLPSSSARIRFISPAVLLQDGKKVPQPSFDVLVDRLTERISDLVCLFGIDGRGSDDSMCVPAAPVRTLARPTPEPFDRYQRAAGKSFDAGGALGDLLVEGDLAPWHALLRAGEMLHVGNLTTHGNGAFRVLPLTELTHG